eukprot:Skav225056  [mRNA]  locus=scaffold3690:54618:56093:+ [translate_table: standard]
MSFVIPRARADWGVIRHVSQGFQDLLGCQDCAGVQQLLSPATLLQSDVLKVVSKEAGLSSDELASSIHRMSQAAEDAVQRTAEGVATPVLLSHCQSGELFASQIPWRKNVHPTLGWSYYLGLVQLISKDELSVRRLLSAASRETTYADLCKEAPAPHGLSEKLGSEVHAAAEKMWKDELAKGVKPAGSSTRNREADMHSIWSRSTASTISAEEKKPSSKVEGNCSQFGSHHFGAMLGMLPSSEESESSPQKQIQEASSEAFQSASEDDFEECETMSTSSSLDSEAPLFDEVVDPVKHVDRARLRQMKQAFALATGSSHDFPIALRSAGLEESSQNWPMGPAWRVGCDAREAFQPGPQAFGGADRLWENFCHCFEHQKFFKTEETGGGIGLLENLEVALPAGEFAFVQPFHGPEGNPIACLVYVKHVELDDCPFLLALHSYAPCGPDSLQEEFDKLSAGLDEVLSELATEFFYYAPMRRQKTFRTNRFSTGM